MRRNKEASERPCHSILCVRALCIPRKTHHATPHKKVVLHIIVLVARLIWWRRTHHNNIISVVLPIQHVVDKRFNTKVTHTLFSVKPTAMCETRFGLWCVVTLSPTMKAFEPGFFVTCSSRYFSAIAPSCGRYDYREEQSDTDEANNKQTTTKQHAGHKEERERKLTEKHTTYFLCP